MVGPGKVPGAIALLHRTLGARGFFRSSRKIKPLVLRVGSPPRQGELLAVTLWNHSIQYTKESDSRLPLTEHAVFVRNLLSNKTNSYDVMLTPVLVLLFDWSISSWKPFQCSHEDLPKAHLSWRLYFRRFNWHFIYFWFLLSRSYESSSTNCWDKK